MGYNTRFNLTVKISPTEFIDDKSIMDELKKKNTIERDFELLNRLKNRPLTENEIISEFRSECEDAEYSINEDGGAEDPCSWYEHEKDLNDFSRKYPDVLFELYGEGENPGDMWKKYFRNGKMQVCKAELTFPPFDEKKLV
jgi:hypothetical protein